MKQYTYAPCTEYDFLIEMPTTPLHTIINIVLEYTHHKTIQVPRPSVAAASIVPSIIIIISSR